jgi:hypothetical protein
MARRMVLDNKKEGKGGKYPMLYDYMASFICVLILFAYLFISWIAGFNSKSHFINEIMCSVLATALLSSLWGVFRTQMMHSGAK